MSVPGDDSISGKDNMAPIRLQPGNTRPESKLVGMVVRGVVRIILFAAMLCAWFDSWIIDGLGVNGLATFARVLSYPARLLEWGLIQWYALVIVASLLGCGVYYVWK